MSFRDLDLTDDGYWSGPLLSEDDLSVIQKIIFKKVNTALPASNFTNFQDIIDNYSKLIHDLFKIKKNRILADSETDCLLKLDSIKKLINCFPQYSLGSVVYGKLETENRPEIYFRVVRPDCHEDVGPVHCDAWFNELYGVYPAKGNRVSYKAWIAIMCESGSNGLAVVPGSHKNSYAFTAVASPDGPRPRPNFSENEVDLKLINTNPGDAIIFPDNLLHKGVINFGSKPRVSIEIAFF